jgi:hypothetical protein
MMDFKFLWNRIRYLILDPDKAWHSIYNENRPLQFVKRNYFFPLLILVSLSAFLGSLLFINTGVSEFYSVLAGIKYFILFFIVIHATTFIFREILKALDITADFSSSFKIILYSLSPLLLCQIISRLFESFIFINVLALYGLYIFWVGVEIMLNPPEHKKIPLLISVSVALVALFIITSWLLTLVVDKVYFTFFA